MIRVFFFFHKLSYGLHHVQVKNLLAVDPDDLVPLRKMLIRKIPR